VFSGFEMAWNRTGNGDLKMSNSNVEEVNKIADYWRYDVGVNVIPADTKRKATDISWSQWQDQPIPREVYDEWKNSGTFKNGVAVVLGKVWHNRQKEGLYLNGIDCDNLKAIEEICSRNGKTVTLAKLAQWTLVEQHLDDVNKAHIYSHRPWPKKSSDSSGSLTTKVKNNEIPAIEVKGLGAHGIFFCTPSIHKNGQPYQIIGSQEPVIADDFLEHIDNICKKYSILYLDDNGNGSRIGLVPIRDLFKPEFKIVEGHNRHEALMRVMESLITRTSDILSYEQIYSLAKEWNRQHCSPPLDDKEFEKQWKCAIKYISNNKDGNNGNNYSNNGINQTTAAVLFELSSRNTKELFKDQYGTAYAKVLAAEHDELIRIESLE
jgi:hypothetical protein